MHSMVVVLLFMSSLFVLTPSTKGADATTKPLTFDIEGARFDPKSNGIILLWDPLPGFPNQVYHVSVADSPDFKNIVFMADTPGTLNADANVLSYKFPRSELAAAKKSYVYRVSTVTPDGRTIVGTVPTPTDPSAASADSISLSDSGGKPSGSLEKSPFTLSLQKSFTNKISSDGAAFSYARASSSSATATYNADFALVLQEQTPLFRLRPDQPASKSSATGFAVLEGHLNSNPDTNVSEHDLIAQVGLDDFENWQQDVFQTDLKLSAKYESSQSANVQKAVASLRLFPICEPIGIDQELNIIKGVLGFQHEVNVGIDAGGTTRGVGASTLEKENGVFRLVGEFHPELDLDFLRPYVPGGAKLYADDTLQYLATARRMANFLQAGANLNFTDNIGVSFYYKVGESAPQFSKVQSINLALTVKF